MKAFVYLLATLCVLAPGLASASGVRFTGSASSDNAIVIATDDVWEFDRCSLSVRAGTVDVWIDPDGAGFMATAYSLDDYGATTADPVLAGAAGHTYLFIVKARYIQVLQNGATAAAAVLSCWREAT